ncbi:MAG: hypothetical protein KIS87_07055 [Phycisphaeraceae bacterium]|nr:hypothetical protein [Phycisphaeraceae bacterium]
MLARFAILMLAVGVFLQPLLAGVHATDDCCAVPDGPAAAPSAEGEGGHECCDGETPQGADEGQPSDRDRDDRRPRGCDCPKSCCTTASSRFP